MISYNNDVILILVYYVLVENILKQYNTMIKFYNLVKCLFLLV